MSADIKPFTADNVFHTIFIHNIRHFLCTEIVGSWGFAPDPIGEVAMFPKYIDKFSLDQNLVCTHLWQILGSETRKKIDFCFNYTSGFTFRYEFSKLF